MIRRRRGLSSLPRWVADPKASDFASEERLRAELDEHGVMTWQRVLIRYWRALALAFGSEDAAWPIMREDRFPAFPRGWNPAIREGEPGPYVAFPDAPPPALVAEVERWQDEEDLAHAELVAMNRGAHHAAT